MNIMSSERVYLDYNSTSLMDDKVIDIIQKLLQENIALNPSSIHSLGRQARGILENARNQIASALNFDLYKNDYQLIFTSSGSEANNLAITSFLKIPAFIGATEHVSILEINHPNKTLIPVNADGIIEKNSLSKLLKENTGPKLVSIMLANNETGVIQNIKELVEIAHNEGAIVHCDASQAFGKIEVDLLNLNCDLLTISSHKCGGPAGAAALVANKKFQLFPLIKGGKQEQGLRAGTENLIAIAGFGAAVRNYQDKITKFKKLAILRDEMEREILTFAPNSIIIAKDIERLPNTSCIRMPNVKSEEQLIKFDLAGICVSAGAACSSGRIASSHVLKAMNIDEKMANEIIRVSIGMQTTAEHLKRFVELWKEIYSKGNI